MKEKVKELTEQIESSKIMIAHERDKMRALYEELDSFLYDVDTGIDSIENGLREIESGLDEFSQKI